MRSKKRKRSKFKPRRRQRRIQNNAPSPGIERNNKPVDANPRGPPEALYFTKAQVLELVGKTWPCVWQWIREGKFPQPHMLGGRTIFLVDEIKAWFAALPVPQYKPLEEESDAA